MACSSPGDSRGASGGRRRRGGGCCSGTPTAAAETLARRYLTSRTAWRRWWTGVTPTARSTGRCAGGARDNSPYIGGFAATAREWNERWVYPRLVVSTNARFYADLAVELPADLPVFRGELPGQDYPVGAASTAEASGVNRATHGRLAAAETLATLAAATTDHAYPAADLGQAYEDLLWYDEHTWGHHFPAGAAARASRFEKQVHAYRAEALAQDIAARALARLADHLELPGEGVFLVVANPLPWERQALVSTPLRELENCGSVMVVMREGEADDAPTYLRGVALTDRWHVHPPAELLSGAFELVDLASGHAVDFELLDLEGADDPLPEAAERVGLSAGGKRYGFFERPSGLARQLRFVAEGLPAGGYRTYELRPLPPSPAPPSRAPRQGLSIENEYYRLEADGDSGRVVSWLDRETGTELLDPGAPHSLGQLVVRSPEEVLAATEHWEASVGAGEGSCQRLLLRGAAPGLPRVHMALELHAGLKRLDLAVRVLKDPTPLLDTHLAFRSRSRSRAFATKAVLAAISPPEDFLPGAYWDEVAVQNWLSVSGGGVSVLVCGIEAGLFSLGGLQPGYTSPAHSCLIPERANHPPAGPEQLRQAWLYSLLFAGNFGTNFAVSQTGSVLFRYHLGTVSGEVTDAAAGRWGAETVTPPETIFASPRGLGHLAPHGGVTEDRGRRAAAAVVQTGGGRARLRPAAVEPGCAGGRHAAAPRPGGGPRGVPGQRHRGDPGGTGGPSAANGGGAGDAAPAPGGALPGNDPPRTLLRAVRSDYLTRGDP